MHEVMDAEVERLLKAGFIHEVHHFEWVLNMVIFKKKNGKWSVCVDFIDVNKSCPIDPFPLPIINQLLDVMFACQVFSFLDAYSSYN